MKHTVHQLIFEIEGFQNNAQFQKIASQISTLVRVTLKNELNKLLDKYNINGYHIVLENIEIDIGALNIFNLTNTLARLIRLELNKQLTVVHTKAVYDIKHNKANSLEYISQKGQTLSRVLDQKQIETQYELSKDPTHYFQTISHQKVVPEDARYYDAVIHYLEYGWLPRYLDIPMLEFDEILVNTLTEYGDEIVKHFGRKPKNQKEKITERILRQTAKNRFLKKNKKAAKTLSKTVLGKNSSENVQSFIKLLEHLATSSQSFTKDQQKELISLSKEFEDSSEILKSISGIIGITEKELKANDNISAPNDVSDSSNFNENKSVTGINSASFNPFYELNERIKAILNDDKKVLFNKILESNFYKSLVQSYVPKTDSYAVILRTLLPIILTPDKSETILLTAPEILDSENELINQLYARSPFLLNKIVKSIGDYNSTPEKIFSQVTTLFSKLSKKQVNKILNSYFSYYSSLSVQLNDINKLINTESYENLLSHVSHKILGHHINSTTKPTSNLKASHIQLLGLIILSNQSPQTVLKQYIKEVKIFFLEEELVANKVILEKLSLNSKVKDRSFSNKELADSLAIETLKQEQILLQKQNEEVTLYSFRTLLKDFYLPVKFSSEIPKLDDVNIISKNEEISEILSIENQDVSININNKTNPSTEETEGASEITAQQKEEIDNSQYISSETEKGQDSPLTSENTTDKDSKNKESQIKDITSQNNSDPTNIIFQNVSYGTLQTGSKRIAENLVEVLSEQIPTSTVKSKSYKAKVEKAVNTVSKIITKATKVYDNNSFQKSIEEFINSVTLKVISKYNEKSATQTSAFKKEKELARIRIDQFINKQAKQLRARLSSQLIKETLKIFDKVSNQKVISDFSKNIVHNTMSIVTVNILKNSIEKFENQVEQTAKDKLQKAKTITNISYAKDIPSLLDQVEHFKIKKSKILKIFSGANILKNPVLAKLTRNTFYRLIKATLSTNKARQYIKFFEKYERIFKINVSTEQIQLIFINLLKHHKVLDEKNIFKFYYEALKNLKGWTYDVHKKKLIQMYESRSEILTQEERDEFVKYVDEVPTYLGLELRDTKKKLEEGIPIKNAGLCLLWPFFKTLFSVSGYLDPKGEFKNVEMRERATLLLQYLAVKSTAIEEPYLALNKIFTGLPLEESLPQEITLTEKEKDIADGLLLNVIKQWPSFNNSSTENLRGSFIIRDGVLFFRGKQWVLRVENKAYDLLLNKLPWGFSMIRLSWIPYIIKVEWN